jgi:DNA-binding CsgD family transcriptional regulator
LAHIRAIGDRVGLAVVHHNRGVLLLTRGEVATAAEELAEALPLRWEVGDRRGAATTLTALAAVAAAAGDLDRAGRFLDAAQAICAEIGPPVARGDRALLERTEVAVRRAQGPVAPGSMPLTGPVLTAEETMVEAARLVAAFRQTRPHAAPVSLSDPTIGFTPRELDVLRLLADGRSDREIGESLFISHRTVATHVASILSKLDMPSRTAAAAYAIRHGLG